MTAAEHPFRESLTVVLARRAPKDVVAAGLQSLQGQRGVLAAEEAEWILRFAELTPADGDPPPDHPGAKRRGWSPDEERPGVSEFFLDELAMALDVGRGTAAFRARRAFCWRDRLPATFAALKRGELDERRAQELFLVVEHVDTGLARRVDTALVGEASDLSVRALGERARALILEWDAAAADERRRQRQAGADVFVEPAGDGLATIGADLPAEQAAEAYALIDHLAVLAKTDGDERPIHRIRTEIFSLLLRRPGLAAGVQAQLTITATLESLEGSSGAPGEVNGFVITPTQLRSLLARTSALGLTTPEGGTCTLGVVDSDGRLLATTDPADLERRVRRSEGLSPPPATDAYEPTDRQRAFVRTRDRRCRFPTAGSVSAGPTRTTSSRTPAAARPPAPTCAACAAATTG